MTYFYDADICFTRLSFPHMLSATNAPPGCGSIQAEVYFSSKYRPLTQSPNDLIDQVIADLRRTGTLREHDKRTSSSTSIAPHSSRRCTVIWTTSVSPIAGGTETGDTCGLTRASSAGSVLQSWPCHGAALRVAG